MTHQLGPVLDHYGVQYRNTEGNQSILCPVHGDRRKSASAQLGQGVWHCFTCGEGGDAITLIMLMERCAFSEAKSLADEIAGPPDGSVSRGDDRGSSYLPRRKGHRPGRRRGVSPWGSERP